MKTLSKQFLKFIFAGLILISCTKTDKILEEKKALLISEYQINKTADSAVKLSEFYNREYSNNSKQINEGVSMIEDLLSEFPNEQRLKILLGNLYTIYGGVLASKLDYSNAMRNMTKGFSMMDELIMQYPDDHYFLIYRGINSASVPKMFNRSQYAESDLRKIIETDNVIDEIKILAYREYSQFLKENKRNEEYKKITEDFKIKFPGVKK